MVTVKRTSYYYTFILTTSCQTTSIIEIHNTILMVTEDHILYSVVETMNATNIDNLFEI